MGHAPQDNLTHCVRSILVHLEHLIYIVKFITNVGSVFYLEHPEARGSLGQLAYIGMMRSARARGSSDGVGHPAHTTIRCKAHEINEHLRSSHMTFERHEGVALATLATVPINGARAR